MIKTATALSIIAATSGAFANTGLVVPSPGSTDSMVFSQVFLSTMQIANFAVTALAPASWTGLGTTIPYTGFTLNTGSNGALSGTTAISSMGGVIVYGGLTAFGSGGTLTISNLGLNAVTGYVTANLSATGQPNLSQVDLFEINSGSINGTTYDNHAAFVAGLNSTALAVDMQLNLVESTLTLNPAYQSYLQNSLGFNAVGLAALNGITDFGTITVTVLPGVIPEPTTYVMLSIGLAGMAISARSRRSKI